MSSVEFTAVAPAAARCWMRAQAELAACPDGPATLTEPYARLEGRRIAPCQVAVGF